MSKATRFGADLARPAGSGGAAPFPPSETGGNGARGPRRLRQTGGVRAGENGARFGAARLDAPGLDAEAVIARLEEAGATLLALPQRGYSTRLRLGALEIVRAASEAYGWEGNTRLRPPVPSAAQITRMDEAFSWLGLIPDERYVLRRILAARALTHPLTGRHLYPWRRLGTALGADHKAIQRWHREAVGLLVAALAGR
ncbi:MAG: DUF6362 family protein [Acidibrevibacterium sp.]|uniref:DUF6362 family protein n=1 Tax=Acidibrevibacterium sp. TaxID=2606776 RepID=UPI003D0242A0